MPPTPRCYRCNSEVKLQHTVPDTKRKVTVYVCECAQCGLLHYLSEKDGELRPWGA